MTPLDQARLFLERVYDWSAVGEGAWAGLHATFLPSKAASPDDRAFWSMAVTSVDDAMKALAMTLKAPSVRDIYFCTTLQRVAVERSDKRQFPAAKRRALDAVSSKLLVLDIDVKPKSYPTTAVAVAALQDFLAKSKVVKPNAVVQSGSGGLHVYWLLDRAIPIQRWRIMAQTLVDLVHAHGLQADTQCTLDAARIMRIPGTVNRKNDTSKPVVLTRSMIGPDITVEDMEASLGIEGGHNVVQLNAMRISDAFIDIDAGGLAAGIQRKSGQIILESVLPHCGFLKTAVETGGNGFNYDLWYATMQIATFTVGGLEDAQRMSMGDPRYNEANVEAKYEQVLNARKGTDAGWISCAKIQGWGCGDCSTCPNLSKGLSPLNFGVTDLPLTEDGNTVTFVAGTAPKILFTNTITKPYVTLDDGRIYRDVVTEGGDMKRVLVVPYPIQDGWIEADPWVLNFTTRIGTPRRDTPVSLSLEVIQGSPDTFSRAASQYGFVLNPIQQKSFREFLMNWFSTLQALKDSIVDTKSNGWIYDNGQLAGFSYGGTAYIGRALKPARQTPKPFDKLYRPTGSADVWLDAVKLVTERNNIALTSIIAAIAGAPLIALTGYSGCILNAVSLASGVGKTTAARIGYAIWGHPVEGVQTLDDTEGSLAAKVGILSNLPLMWDEVRINSAHGANDQWVKTVWRLASGAEKQRLNKDLKAADRNAWKTMVITTSNQSLFALMADASKGDTAGMMRMFEVVVPQVAATHDLLDASMLSAKLEHNYGHIGRELAQKWGSDPDKVQETLSLIRARITARVEFQQSERIWQAAMVVIVAGADYLNGLGVWKVDIDELIDFLLSAVKRMRVIGNENARNLNTLVGASSALNAIIAAAIPEHLIVTQHAVTSGSGRPKATTVQSDTSKLKSVHVRICHEPAVVIMERAWASRALTKAGYDSSAAITALCNAYSGVVDQRNITGGTHLMSVRDWCVTLSKPGLVDEILTGFQGDANTEAKP